MAEPNANHGEPGATRHEPDVTRREDAPEPGPGATRREDAPEPGPGATHREDPPEPGPGATRREDPPGEPPHATRREPDPPAPPWSALPAEALPAALAARLGGFEALPSAGGEAQLAKVTDSAHPGTELVLKVYHRHIRPDADVWAQLAAIRSKHVVRIVETGTLTDGRVFELMEYLPGGSLRDAGAGKHTFDTKSVTEIVRQLADGLAALHAERITHRDLKPENILVRGRNPVVELVLADFGLSRRLDSTTHFTGVARTAAYAAPEAWTGHVSPALDWWSLGIVVLELVTGQQPFHGLDDLVIHKFVATKPVPVDAIADARLNRLCAGLLVSDDTKRWSGTQVRDWLSGGSPQVPDRRVPVDATEFEFGGRRFRDPESLAVALARNWKLAASRYGISPSPSWTALTQWLHQFDNPDQYPVGVVEARLDLLGRLEQSTEKPDVKLLRLLAGLNPRQPPVYRRAHIDPAKLRQLARRAQDGPDGDAGTERAREIVDELWDGRLLDVLAGFEGAAELGQVAARWATAVAGLRTAVATLKRNPRLADAFRTTQHRSVARAAMLERAAGAPCGDDWLRELTDRASRLPERVGWFTDLLRWVGGEPVRAYAGLFAAGVAQAEAQRIVLERDRVRSIEEGRRQWWDRHERQREAGRAGAVGRAVGGAAVLGVLWLLVVGLSAKTPALGLVSVAMMTHLAAEWVLAYLMAADYHPRYSLWQASQVGMGQTGSRLRRSPGFWTVVIILTLVALALVPWLAPIAAIAATIAHVTWAVIRYRRWSAAHEAEHHEAMTR
ncbi:serine/threonine-protein kinase [Amycolatopsis sp. CA-128772]|uniref:serine/threonine-protein kinase n=1 Tax=Amycolatopsis sp. CA-128772 TaxID=2073159 RepID=UPI000CD016CE|nr:protein kinase [Amycolatopsis sp. CA-128772]